MSAAVALLRAPRFVLAVLAFTAIYCAVGAWLPWATPGGAPPPPWVEGLGLAHPFSAPPFLAAVALLFASTLACTWGRRARIAGLLRGELPPAAVALQASGADARAFLEARGFRGEGDVLRRFGWALWGGWVLHVGLLVLVAGILAQQAFHDEGAFELTEGGTARLSEPGVVQDRERGLLAPQDPPALEVELQSFDPGLHQEGYAPDRASRIAIARPGGAPRLERLDRAAGARVGAVEIFQAIPAGLAVNVVVEGLGARSIHLRKESAHVAAAWIDNPAGRPARVVAATERAVDDPVATGRIAVSLEQDGRRLALEREAPFRLGDREARVIGIGRWTRFTYARSPGMPGVLAGLALVLAGCALLAVPAGVARLGAPGAGPSARVYLPRGREALLAEWRQQGSAR